jgi:hypothetical protein
VIVAVGYHFFSVAATEKNGSLGKEMVATEKNGSLGKKWQPRKKMTASEKNVSLGKK